MNDLSTNINGFLVQYADDTQFLHSGTIHDLEQLIKDTEETLPQCKRFYLKNGLMFNSSKTVYFYRKPPAFISYPPKHDLEF